MALTKRHLKLPGAYLTMSRMPTYCLTSEVVERVQLRDTVVAVRPVDCRLGRRVDRALGRGLWGVRVEHDDGNYDDGECRGGQQAEGVFRRGLLMESFIDFSLVMRVLQLSVWRPGWWRSCSY